MKKIYRIEVAFIITFLIMVTLNGTFLGDSLNFIKVIILLIMGLLTYKLLDRKIKFNVFTFINAFLLSLFIVVGKCFDRNGTITIVNSQYNIFIFLGAIFSLTFFINLILARLYETLDRYKFHDTKINNKFIEFIFYKHPFLSMSGVTIFFSLVYLWFFYPGTVSFDGIWQLNSYYRFWTFNDHHPALLSIFLARLFRLGQNLGSDNLGIFFYVIIQVVVNGLVYGYTLKIMDKINAPLWLRVFTFLFLSSFPFWVINSITYIKDTIYYLVFLLLFTFQYYHLEIKKDMKVGHFIFLMFLYIILYLWRNTGFYIAIINLITLILLHFKNKKKVVVFGAMLLNILFINTIYHKVFLPHYDILEGNVREKMSIPLQQTARYLKEYPNDVSQKEKEYIEDLFLVQMEQIKELYDPVRSDNVKRQIKDYPTKEELSNYFKAWWSMFLRHPIVYIDATINNTYGYFYSQHKNFIGEELGFYDITNYNFKNIKFREETEMGRKFLKDVAQKICDMPIIGLFYGSFLYVFTIIILSFYLLSKKEWRFIFYLVPIYVTIILCIISPVNGHMRYLEPVAVSIPIIIAFFLIKR